MPNANASKTTPDVEPEALFLAGILAVAIVVRFQGLNWDHGLMLHPDERNLATAAARLSYPDALIPDFHAYNGLSVYLPRLLAELLASLGFSSSTGVAEIAWASRALSALFSVATVYVMYCIAAAMFDGASALLAAAVTAVTPGLVQAAHFGTTESALVLLLALVCLTSVTHIRSSPGSTTLSLVYGVLIGLALGFKTTAAGFFIVPIASAAIRFLEARKTREFTFVPGMMVLALAIFAITTPQIIRMPADYLNVMRFEGGVVSGTVDVFWTYQFHDAVPVLFELRQLPWLAGIAVAVLAVPGLATILWRLRSRDPVGRTVLPLLAFSVIYAGIIFSWHAKFIRYLVPLLPILILSAVACVWNVRSRFASLGPVVAYSLVYAVALQGLLQASIYQRQDSRISAWNYLLKVANPSDSLVIEPVEVGLPLPGGESLQLQTSVLPLIEPSSPEKVMGIASTLARAQWLVISSRRHHQVLPGMRERFPEMCGYYKALWLGELGFKIEATFNRRPGGLLAWLDPSAIAEETLSVFDSPTVYVLRNHMALDKREISARILAGQDACDLALAKIAGP